MEGQPFVSEIADSAPASHPPSSCRVLDSSPSTSVLAVLQLSCKVLHSDSFSCNELKLIPSHI